MTTLHTRKHHHQQDGLNALVLRAVMTTAVLVTILEDSTVQWWVAPADELW